MEDFGGVFGQIGTIFGFLAFCIAMIWKVVSDKKENDKSKETAEKITKILEYITKEREENRQRQDDIQKQVAENTKAISSISANMNEISVILEKVTAKLNQRPKKKITPKNVCAQ